MRARAAHRSWPDVGSPGSRPRSFCTCQVLRPRRAARTLRWCVRNVLPSALETASAPGGLENAMDVSTLDGFLCAVLSGPNAYRQAGVYTGRTARACTEH